MGTWGRGCAILSRILGLAVLSATLAAPGWAEGPTDSERFWAGQWTLERFGQEAVGPLESPKAGISILKRLEWVTQNSVPGDPDQALRFGENRYSDGLFTHAPSHLRVTFPSPVRHFSALAGVLTNPFSAGGKGSVLFIVRSGERELFKSDLRKEGMDPLKVELDLDGVTALDLIVDPAGEYACDTAGWVRPTATLANGDTLAIASMPILDGQDENIGAGGLPFSFRYGDRASADLLPKWKFSRQEGKGENARTDTLIWLDPETQLEVRCDLMRFSDFPTVQWTVQFTNRGKQDTPLLTEVRGLDTLLKRHEIPHPPAGEFELRSWNGSTCADEDFKPRCEALLPKSRKTFAPNGGRSSDGILPYFNLRWEGVGVLAAVGWPGQWQTDFVRDEGTGLRLQAGQQTTRFVLRPGESARTPLIALQFYRGDWVHAQNVWRRWMSAHVTPRPGGKPLEPFILAYSGRVHQEMTKATTENQKEFIDRYLDEKIPLDYWWIDAGWYPCDGDWTRTGTWEVDKKRFQNGLREVSDYARQKGLKTLLWFEPERMRKGSWLSQNKPEWLWNGPEDGLVKFHLDEVRDWFTERIDSILTREGIDLYRQDCNLELSPYWNKANAETPDRQGLVEQKHLVNLLGMWDELQRRHPNLILDTCASGGRRIDLEFMRRSVPLWRTDRAYLSEPSQAMTYGLSFWFPFTGTGTVACQNASYYGEGMTSVESYAFWSNVAPSLNCTFDVRAKLDYEKLRVLFSRLKRIQPFMFGDFYPLTEWSLSGPDWIGWQFDVPERGEGCLLLFRHPASQWEAGRFPLRGLDPKARYRLESVDGRGTQEGTGEAFLQEGVRVEIEEKPGAAIWVYRRDSFEKVP